MPFNVWIITTIALPKESQWVKPTHLDHLPKMVEKFELEHGHEMGNRNTHKDKSNTST